jgi:hypothetical protein
LEQPKPSGGGVPNPGRSSDSVPTWPRLDPTGVARTRSPRDREIPVPGNVDFGHTGPNLPMAERTSSPLEPPVTATRSGRTGRLNKRGTPVTARRHSFRTASAPRLLSVHEHQDTEVEEADHMRP